MNMLALLSFACVFALACASPGPTILALISRVIGRGTGGILSSCGGLMIGDVVWLSCAMFGLAAIATLFQPVFLVIRYLGAAYLLFIAWKLWTAPAAAQDETAPLPERATARPFIGGLALALGNPKTMLFYLAILPSVVPLQHAGWSGFAELAGIVAVIYSGVLCGYVVLAARMRRLFTSRRAVRLMNRTTGTVMAGAAIGVAAGA